MNVFNRVIVSFVLLISIPLLVTTFVIPHIVLVALGEWLASWGYTLGNVESTGLRLGIGIALALVWILLALFLLWLELRRSRRVYVRVPKISGGMVTLSIESITQQVQYRMEPLANVVRVQPQIQAQGGGVRAVIDVTAVSGINVPQLSSDLVEVVRRTLSEDLGLKIAGDPQIRLKLILPTGGSVPVMPVAPVIPPVSRLPATQEPGAPAALETSSAQEIEA